MSFKKNDFDQRWDIGHSPTTINHFSPHLLPSLEIEK
jgi:hypothetical protein